MESNIGIITLENENEKKLDNSEILAKCDNKILHQCNQQIIDDVEDIIGKRRRRSSSMDILAEAASVSCSTFSGQTSRASDDCQWESEGENKKDNQHNIGKLSNVNKLRRPRGATFSYSPFTSKDPDLVFSPKSGEKLIALNWIANFQEDEHATADLLSSLSQFRVYDFKISLIIIS